MSSSLIIVLILTQFSAILTAVPKLPRKCKLSDSECLRTTAQEVLPVIAEGMPEIGTEPLDVMHIPKNKIDLAGLKMTTTDTYIKGMKNAAIKSINFDTGKHMLKIVYDTDMDIKAKYKASGQLLVLPINGDGDMSIDLKTLHIEMTMPYQIVKDKNNADTLELKSYQYKYEVKGGAKIDLTNLFNGNKELSDPLITFMNENWKTLSVEFGPPLLDKIQKKIFDVMKTYFHSQPLNSLAEI